MPSDNDAKIEANKKEENETLDNADLQDVSGGGRTWGVIKKFANDHALELTALGAAAAVGGIAIADHVHNKNKYNDLAEDYDDVLEQNEKLTESLHSWQKIASEPVDELNKQARQYYDEKLQGHRN